MEWNTICTAVRRSLSTELRNPFNELNNSTGSGLQEVLRSTKMEKILLHWYNTELRSHLSRISKEFWSSMDVREGLGISDERIHEAMSFAHRNYTHLKQVTCTLTELCGESAAAQYSIVDCFDDVFACSLLYDNCNDLATILARYFKRRYLVHHMGWKDHCEGEGSDGDEGGSDDGGNEESFLSSNTLEDAVIDTGGDELFIVIMNHLRSMGWMRRLDSAYSTVLYDLTAKRIQMKIEGEFFYPMLGRMVAWLDDVVKPWLQIIVGVDTPEFQQWYTRLEIHAYETFCDSRIDSLFNMIQDYPDSKPSIEDLGKCLQRTHQQAKVVKQLRGAFQKRLLIPGAKTDNIIEIYIRTIYTLRILDPSGVLLEAVNEPVKAYLKNRRDTVKRIIHDLTNEEGELFKELGKGDGMAAQGPSGAEEEEEKALASWAPDPWEADPTKSSRSRRTDDIISLLVNIYGSTELFVSEYRMTLADKLLQNAEFDINHDVRTLELLKLRFGETNLQNCEVMIRDVRESKKVNSKIAQSLPVNNESFDVTATIVSNHYWPPFVQSDTTRQHPKIENQLKNFSGVYKTISPQKLEWQPSLGSVTLDVELGGETREFTVSTLQASLLLYFEERREWAVKDLADSIGMSEDAVVSKMQFWVAQGLVLDRVGKGEGRYVRSDRWSSQDHDGEGVEEEKEEEDSKSSAESKAANLMLEQIVMGMMNNYGDGLPADRIHNNLKIFFGQGDLSLENLHSVIHSLVQQGKLEFTGVTFKKVK